MTNICEYPGCKVTANHNIVHPKTDLIMEACDRHKELIIEMITSRRRKPRRLFFQKSLDPEEF